MGPKRNYSIFEKTTAVEPAKKRKPDEPMKILSWNVAGLNACVKKNGYKVIEESDADIVVLQETKSTEFPAEIQRIAAYPYMKLYASESKKGYSGVALLSKEKPLNVILGIGDKRFDTTARLIQAEFENFWLLGVYVPNSGRGLVNLALREVWEELILNRLVELDKLKPVCYVGDLNVAHEEIDLANPKQNANKTAGFTDQERNDFQKILDSGFVDVYRHLNPKETGAYTFWSYMGNARAKNVGWRLDYFVISERIINNVIECHIHKEIVSGSDHCPISLKLRI
uniref:exodeoxyribonuclease III n=1 Tax=Acrobeloides nanus TaxID=290746 RepID=A0A914CHS9_9BILA